ncbi:MAG: hypothetical protein WD023_00760 [Ilumatobacteraceae bacterium]
MSDERSEVVATWVRPQSLRPFVETISRWVGYGFDDTDWLALADGVEKSDADARQWFMYPIDGVPRLDVEVALNVGHVPVSVRVLAEAGLSDVLRVQIEAAAAIFNSYDLA